MTSRIFTDSLKTLRRRCFWQLHSTPLGKAAEWLIQASSNPAYTPQDFVHPERLPILTFENTTRSYLRHLLPQPIYKVWGPLPFKHMVNLRWWDRRWYSPTEAAVPGNLGDILSPVIVEMTARTAGHSLAHRTSRTQNLLAIGSLLGMFGRRGQTVWGTGYEPSYATPHALDALCTHDFRAVRGPLTARYLQDRGVLTPPHSLPLGDPAVLLPLFYTPTREREESPLAILHGADPIPTDSPVRIMSVLTEDWRASINTIASASLVVSTSLHGIILAEAYDVPAIMIDSPRVNAHFKFKDWYLSTGRTHYPIAHSIDEALTLTPPPLPDLTTMQHDLLEVFPFDLWD